ncbi:AAA family ATPase [Pseudomonas aeruginosa]|uniref:AAA family ATPase n=1 Tax=Pseudomonas aeruginosa TaxID=287 RepID=UPI0032E48FE3
MNAPAKIISDIERARQALWTLDAGVSRDEWVKIGMAAKAAGLDFEDFNDWSATAGNYGGASEARSAWKSFKEGGGINAGTLFRRARDAGWSDPANGNYQERARKPSRKPLGDWESGEPATAVHPYITRKGGTPKGLRVVSWPLQGWGDFKGRSLQGWLMVPVRAADGSLVSVQYIGPNGGEKLNAPGCQMAGTFTVGELAQGAPAYIVEGIGHAWSVHTVTGKAAVVSFGAGNIEKAAAAIKAAGAAPVIVPDRGKEEQAKAAALRLGCACALLPDDLEEGADVNDLHLSRGADAVLAVLDGASQAPANDNALQAGGNRFAFLSVGSLVEHLKPIDWLVKGYVERDSMAVIYGEPGHGKSFVAIDMACCVATGTAWHGRPVKPGAVFYIAGEGHNGLARRFRAWSEARGVSLAGSPLYVSNRSAALTEALSAATVAATVRELAATTGEVPSLIVIDTLARNFGAADENSAADMGAFVTNLDNNLRHPWKATVAIVHHSGKDTSKGARGSTALRGAVDAEYEIKRDELGTIRMEAHKMKDAENPEPLAFKLEGVELPLLDEDGNRVFGAALQSMDYIEPPKAGKVGRGKNQTKALELLAELEQENRSRLTDSGRDPEAARVSIEQWRDRVIQDAGMDRRRFYDLKTTLLEAGKIIIESGGYVRAA